VAWFDKLVNLLGLVAGILLVALTVLVCCDVMARYFRLFAMPWSLDFAQYGLFVITFFGAPWVLINHGHITIDLVVDRLSNERARVLRRISHTIGALMSGALFLFTCEVLRRTYSDGTTVPDTFMFPEWWIYAFAPTTFLLLMIIFIRWVLSPPEGADASITKDLF